MLKEAAFKGVPLNAFTLYSHPIGQASKINACNGGFWFNSADPNPTAGFPTAMGPFDGKTYSGCEYRGPATAPGSVSCPDMPTWTACSKAPVSTQVCYDGSGFDSFYAQAECEF